MFLIICSFHPDCSICQHTVVWSTLNILISIQLVLIVPLSSLLKVIWVIFFLVRAHWCLFCFYYIAYLCSCYFLPSASSGSSYGTTFCYCPIWLLTWQTAPGVYAQLPTLPELGVGVGYVLSVPRAQMTEINNSMPVQGAKIDRICHCATISMGQTPAALTPLPPQTPALTIPETDVCWPFASHKLPYSLGFADANHTSDEQWMNDYLLCLLWMVNPHSLPWLPPSKCPTETTLVWKNMPKAF